jgi:hypothetical protein
MNSGVPGQQEPLLSGRPQELGWSDFVPLGSFGPFGHSAIPLGFVPPKLLIGFVRPKPPLGSFGQISHWVRSAKSPVGFVPPKPPIGFVRPKSPVGFVRLNLLLGSFGQISCWVRSAKTSRWVRSAKTSHWFRSAKIEFTVPHGCRLDRGTLGECQSSTDEHQPLRGGQPHPES